MQFITTNELKNQYTSVRTTEISSYVSKVINYLEDAITRENVGIYNTLVVAMHPDYRITPHRLYVAADSTSPTLQINYGLLRNSQYTVPVEIAQSVIDEVDTFILGLTNQGFTVSPFFGYSKGFNLLEDGFTYENLNPVKCYKIGWSNA